MVMKEMTPASSRAAKLGWSADIAMPSGVVYRLDCHETRDSIRTLHGAWTGLEKKAGNPFTYFQSFDWCNAWLDTYAATEPVVAEPQVYALWQGETCVLIWPMMRRRIAPGLHLLVPLTAPLNQYSGLLHDPAHVDLAVGREVLACIRHRSGANADALCLDHLPDHSFLAAILAPEEHEGSIDHRSAILDLSRIKDWDSHHKALPKKQRQQRNARRNRLQKLGELAYAVHPAGTEAYGRTLPQCLAMKRQWLIGTGRRGRDLFDPRFEAFLTRIGRVPTADAGQVVLHLLSLDGRPIAMELGMRFRGDYYCFLGAIDLDLQKFSPGKVQMEYSQRWALEAGIRRFDFLNDPSDYKASWTDTEVPLRRVDLPMTPKGHIYCKVWRATLRPKLKALYAAIGPRLRGVVNGAVQLAGRLAGRGTSL